MIHSSENDKSGPSGKKPARLKSLFSIGICLVFVVVLLSIGTILFSAPPAKTGKAYNPPAKNDPPTTSPSVTTVTTLTCDMLITPNCPPPPIEEIPLRSTAPADVLAAMRETTMYSSLQTSPDLIGDAFRTGTVGVPVLVRYYRDNAGQSSYWVLPIMNTSNIPMALLEYSYDEVHHTMEASQFGAVTNNMFYTTHHFPYITSSQAIAIVQQKLQTHQSLQSSPELIYFFSGLGDPRTLTPEQEKKMWKLGGYSADDPIWRVKGTDGHWYYVDHNGQAHLGKDIPVGPYALPLP